MQQNEEKLSTLWVLENVSPAVLRRPILRWAARILLRLSAPRPGPEDWVIGPRLLEGSFPPERFVSWEAVRLMAVSSSEEPDELLAFVRAVVEILEQDAAAWRSGVSIPAAMTYAFLSSFSEDLPFSISGLEVMLKKNRIGQVKVSGNGYWATLASELASSRGLPVESGLGWGVAALNEMLAAAAALRSPRVPSWAHHESGHINKSSSLVCVGKERSLRYASPLLAALGQSSDAIGVGRTGQEEWPGVKMLSDFFPQEDTRRALARLSQECGAVWQRAASKIKTLPHTYRGARLAPFHWREMAAAWEKRAPTAAFCAEKGDDFLTAVSPRALIFQEPLEFSRIFSELAARKGIFRLFHYTVYDSYPLTAGLWESCMKGIADRFCTINEWQKQRLIAGKIAAAEAITVVGDILQTAPARGDLRTRLRTEVLRSAALPPANPLLVILSRGTAPSFSLAEKEQMMKSAFAAAGKSGFSVLVKGHPYESREELLAQLESWNCRGGKVVISELDLKSVVTAADLVVGPAASSSNLDVNYARTALVLTGGEALFRLFDEQDGRYAYRRYQAGYCVSEKENLEEALTKFMRSPEERRLLVEGASRFAEKISGPQDGLAAERIAALIPAPSTSLVFRRALPSDSRDIWNWRNDPETREMSVNSDAVAWESHEAWYARALENPAMRIYVGELSGEGKVGMCRFDLRKESGFADVSINLNPEMRGRKLSQPLLAGTIHDFLKEEPLELRAVVKLRNEASNKLFLRCGFEEASRDATFRHYVRKTLS